MASSRRQFIQGLGATSLALAGFNHWLHSANPQKSTTALELRPDPAGIVEIPTGFSYKVISKTGERMNDGFFVPGRHDGMGTFLGPGRSTIIVRNHELDAEEIHPGNQKQAERLLSLNPRKMYDRGKGKKPAFGGTTTLVYDTKWGELRSHHLSLAGTYRNCSGGATPWGSWISCEENVETPESNEFVDKKHGYCFEVKANDKRGLVDAVPLAEMGRFNHEGVAVDPKTHIVYMSEDRPDGILYRFIPKVKDDLRWGGKLQALKIRSTKSFDTRNWDNAKAMPIGKGIPVEWVDIENYDSPDDDLRLQGAQQKGAALFARAEGICYAEEGYIAFACTSGGKAKKGQIFKYYPGENEGKKDEAKSPGTLELHIEASSAHGMTFPDNLCVSPWGDMFICEDAPKTHNQVFRLTPKGRLQPFVKNVMNDSEFAGAVFSPDGTTLFVNIQTPGMTLAITGPWSVYD